MSVVCLWNLQLRRDGVCPFFDLVAAEFAVQLMHVGEEEGHAFLIRESGEEAVVEDVVFDDEFKGDVTFRYVQSDGVLISSGDMLRTRPIDTFAV